MEAFSMNEYIDEFLRGWYDIYASVESSVITQSTKTGTVNVDVLNSVIVREASAWKNKFESKGKFVEKLRAKNPKAAAEFEHKLENFILTPVNPPKKPSSALTSAACFTGAVGTFSILRFALHAATLISIAGGVIVLAAAGTVAGNATKDKYMALVKETYSAYLRQIDVRRDEIQRVLEKID
jgi:hypothetical protein